jgi:ribosome-associated protein
MKNEYVDKEVEKIVEDPAFAYPKNMAMASAWVLGNLKGVNLKILDVKESSSLCDYFVLASANNHVQANTMADEIMHQLKKHGCKIISAEGLQNTDWILLDAGDILVHIFLEHARDVYDLDTLWIKAPSVEIPQSYYFSSPEQTSKSFSGDTAKDYF